MRQQFAESNLEEDREWVVKASLLITHAIDLAKLPADRFAKSLDDWTGLVSALGLGHPRPVGLL